MQTLILDQGYQPHRVVSWQRAVGMLFGGKVEVVEEYEEEIRSVSLVIRMPAVVRLLRGLDRRTRTVRFSRINVLTRDHFRCQYCGVRLPPKGLTFDHVFPRSRGGGTHWENIVAACAPCNHRKGNRTPAEAAMRLRKRPVRPRALPVVPYRLDLRNAPGMWRTWAYWSGQLGSDGGGGTGSPPTT